MLAALPITAALAAPTFAVDATDRLAPDPCATGPALALVVVARKPGASAWGHAALRLRTCEGGVVDDLLVEAYRLNRHTAADLPARFPAARLPPWRALLRRNRGRLFLRVEPDPATGGDYAFERDANREVWEAWLDLPGPAVEALRDDLLRRADRQKSLLEAGARLEEGRYRALRHSCMVPIAEALDLLDGAPGDPPAVVFPFRALAAVEAAATLRVVHPSPALWAELLDDRGRAAVARDHATGRLAVPRSEALRRRSLSPEAAAWVAALPEAATPPRPPPGTTPRTPESPPTAAADRSPAP